MVARFEIYNPKLLGKVVFHIGLIGAIASKTIICDADGVVIWGLSAAAKPWITIF